MKKNYFVSEKQALVIALVAATTLILSGCGDSRDAQQAITVQPTAIQSFPQTQTGQPVSDFSQVADPAMKAILGTYQGTIRKALDNGSTVSQSYSMVLKAMQVAGTSQTFISMQMDSDGPVGAIHFGPNTSNSNGTPTLALASAPMFDQFGGTMIYPMVSNLIANSGVDAEPVSFELDIALSAGNYTVVPKQTRLTANVCSSSQDLVCLFDLQNVSFDQDLRKL